jgi:hypothetical protein
VAEGIVITLGYVRGQPPVWTESGTYHIVLPRRALAAGGWVALRLAPPPPKGVRVNFGTLIGTMGIGFVDGIYRAPYVIPPGTPPVTVTGSFSRAGIRASATAEIELRAGSVPGAEDCLGPGQSFSTILGDIEPRYTQLDELPQLIQSVEPVYPRGAHGIEETIVIRALLCRTGRVLDAYALPTYLSPGDDQPVERDPRLVKAAIDAVRQYVFSPGKVAGQPVATWFHTAVALRR